MAQIQKSDIAQRFTTLRKEKYRTQKALEQKTGFSQSIISAIESGARSLSAEELPIFADALGTSVQFLVTGIEPENAKLATELNLSNETINNLSRLHNPVFGSVIDSLVNIGGWNLIRRIYNFFQDDFSSVFLFEDNDFRKIPVDKFATTVTSEDLERLAVLNIIDKLRGIRKELQNGKR